jgi:hypothetical protein
MIPLLAPLLGSLAGSLLPATLGSGIAGALGLKGAAGALVASAAPKAIGAGIGTLLAGGDLGDAALNAVGFGAAGALLGGAGSTGAPATSIIPHDAAGHALVSSMPAHQLLCRRQQPKPHRQRHCPIWRAPPSRSQKLLVAASSLSRRVRCRLTGRLGRVPWTTRFWPHCSRRDRRWTDRCPPPATVPVVGDPSMMPASVGIGTIPMGDQARSCLTTGCWLACPPTRATWSMSTCALATW